MSRGGGLAVCVVVSWLAACAPPPEATHPHPTPSARAVDTAVGAPCASFEWPDDAAPSCAKGFTAVGIRCLADDVTKEPARAPTPDALASYDALLAKQKGPPRVFDYAGTPDAILSKAKKDRLAIDSYVAKLEAVLAADDSPTAHVRVRIREGELHDAQRTALYNLFAGRVELRSKRQDHEDCGGECGTGCETEPSTEARRRWRAMRDRYLQTLDVVMLREYVDAALWARTYEVNVPELASASARIRYYTSVVGNDAFRDRVRGLTDPSTGTAFRYVDSMFIQRTAAPLPPIELVDEPREGPGPGACTQEERVLVLTRLGELASKSGETEKAASLARRALRVKADAIPAYLLLARDDIRRGRGDHALATLGLVLDGVVEPSLAPLDASSAEALELRGFVFLERGQKREARSSLTRAALLRADLVGAPMWLGADALSAGNVEGAVGWLERAHRLAPNDVVGNILLGDAYRMLGRAAEAEPLLEAAVVAAPSSVPAHMGLGLLYLICPVARLTDVKRIEAAYSEIKKAIELSGPGADERYGEERRWAKYALEAARASQ